MVLTASNLAYDLIARGLLSAEAAVSGDFAVVDAGRRNSNFKVLRQNGPGLFVKQVRTGVVDAVSTHSREAAFYDVIRSRPALEPIARIVPKLVDYNPRNYTLTVELIPGAENVMEHHWRTGAWPEAIGELLGRSLGLCHAHAGTLVSDPVLAALFPRQLPFVLNIDPATMFPLNSVSPIGPQLAAALQSSGDLLQHLQTLRMEWRLDALIHGDMKLDNCVMFSEPNGSLQLRIVDWELADVGDASWDIGSIVAACVAYWLFTTPMQPGQPIGPEAHARLTAMQPMLRAFWNSYAVTRGFFAQASRLYLLRCLRFCAGRLILGILEYMQNATALTPNSMAVLQVSRNIFNAPEQAARDILGVEA